MGKTLFDSPSFANHEGVHAFHDEKTGLKAIVAVHSTARGPAVGGTRMWNYASAAEALEDVPWELYFSGCDPEEMRRFFAE